ncbi:phosphatase PAP2 family protein [Erythrobacter alti]|uniref:phosphatase PAP2 family protein n=1 Tax=Erythrobacter alti TaxID=1896145 RepID=UPI0030F46C43
MAAAAIGERRLADYFTVPWFIEIFTVLVLPFFVWVLYHSIQAARNSVARPIQYLISKIVDDRRRFQNAAILLLCFAIVNRSYRALKVAIPRLNQYYADTIYAEWDRFIFGVDPWRITHEFIGPAGTTFIDSAYFIWFKVIHVTFALAAFSRDEKFQLQSCFTYFLIWMLLGNVLAIYMSAAGPCYYEHFYGSDRFAPLFAKLSEMNLAAPILQGYLLDLVGDESIGSGISAMPSLHCALTMFIVLLAYRKFGFGWQFATALAYHIVILIGSVHLGWHYAVDGLLSTILVPPIWWSVEKVLFGFDANRRSNPDGPRLASEPL